MPETAERQRRERASLFRVGTKESLCIEHLHLVLKDGSIVPV